MKLLVAERFMLLDLVMSERGTVVTMGAIKKISEKLEFSVEELDVLQVKQTPDGRITWRVTPDTPTESEIDLSEKQVKFIRGMLTRAQGLTVKHFSLFEKFGVKLPEDEEEE